MKEIYAWVPWFKALTEKIAEGGEDGLVARAKEVEWTGGGPLSRPGSENHDPFSFFYYLASVNLGSRSRDDKQSRDRRDRVYRSVGEKFGIESKGVLGDIFSEESSKYGFYFPTPPAVAYAFQNGDANRGKFLWELFRQAKTGSDAVDAELFSKVLQMPKIGVIKLTQCLFLINPTEFTPVDRGIFALHACFGLPAWKQVENRIQQQDGYKYYQTILKHFKSVFRDCYFYEINTALYRMGKWKEAGVRIGAKFFQVSSRVHGHWGNRANEDFWNDFIIENRVYTGGGGDYPLTEPSKGDIILARFGNQDGRGIGVVFKNDYAENGGWSEESYIHVLWVNKYPTKLSGQTRRHGFSKVDATEKTHVAFANAPQYKETFDLINCLSVSNSGNMGDDPGGIAENGPGKFIETNEVSDMPLNQIFYGPPGTGKTYRTVPVAVEILDPACYKRNENHRKNRQQWENLKVRFDDLREQGRIGFVTFHQSFGYEEFVQGIRPVMGDVAEGESQNVSYKVSDGIFKRMCERAGSSAASLGFDDALEKFQADCDDNPIWLKTKPREKKFKVDQGRTSFQCLPEGTERETGYYVSIADVKKAYFGADRKSVWRPSYVFPIAEYIKETYNPDESVGDDEADSTCVLIIDEINRGNISRIFGELITLLEESKRVGNSEETMVTLPQSEDSDEPFGVPNNLYIIGTMNTADRSIALLDTALRRRFRFTEMMPELELLAGITVNGVEIQKLLAEMNKRIEALYDRDHQIGHSFFMKLKDEKKRNIETLAEIFQHEILPLLQEYFYEDWEKINLVLNKNGFLSEEKPMEDLRDAVGDDKKIWSIEKKVFENPKEHLDNFRAIYDNATRDRLAKNKSNEADADGE